MKLIGWSPRQLREFLRLAQKKMQAVDQTADSLLGATIAPTVAAAVAHDEAEARATLGGDYDRRLVEYMSRPEVKQQLADSTAAFAKSFGKPKQTS